MTRHLQAVEPPRGPWFLSTRAEIDAWAADRWRVLSALLEAERQDEPAQLELAKAA
jgi:hypothetical protein